jgi:hypothetical protein
LGFFFRIVLILSPDSFIARYVPYSIKHFSLLYVSFMLENQARERDDVTRNRTISATQFLEARPKKGFKRRQDRLDAFFFIWWSMD